MAALRQIFRLHPLLVSIRRSVYSIGPVSKRTLLSAAYACSKEWEARRETQILKSLDMHDFAIELQKQTQRGFPLSAIDVDVALNCALDAEQVDDVVLLIYKLRHSPKAPDILESTHSAFVRLCLQFGRDDLLLKVLDDPINYGIFLDTFDANVLMDHFLKNGNHRDAAKIASKIMLQEDFSRQSTCWLMVLSCLKWLKEPQPDPWQAVAAESETARGDDDEVVFRMGFLKNYFFDDHFDLVEPPQLLGKTLAWTATHLKHKNLALNFATLGYGVKKDFAKMATALRKHRKERTGLYDDVVKLVFPSKEETTGEEAAAPGEGQKEEQSEITEEANEADIAEVKKLIDELEKAQLIIGDDLEEATLEELNKLLPDLEKKDVEERTATFRTWNEKRQKRVENQVLRYLKKERLKEIEAQRKDVQYVEEYLKFFESRPRLEKNVHPELLKQDEEARRKSEAEQKQLPPDEKYVVPEPSKRKDHVPFLF